MHKLIVKIIAFLELIIGSFTLISLITFYLLSISTKPLNVFVFVLVSSAISLAIGLGLLAYQNWARKTLIFFSMYIIFTKILIFSKLLQFNGEIITFVPDLLKNSVSFLYHSFILFFFSRPPVKHIFNPKA